ncbi:sugar phosphate isomerase/epimerase family protein [Pedobacter immunditicola]|uniref:sugar phosphate isomerase/epimerase family protein n=1 Tax=Pedobacter immunditicola TaxID=3133440 RepID=UPI0030A36BD4
MKKLITVLLMLVCGFAVQAQSVKDLPESKLGWKIGVQSYTFRLFTFKEAIDKIDSCGARFIESFPGQSLGGGAEGKMDYNMSAAERKLVKSWLKDKGLKIVNYGVVSYKTEAEWLKVFEFAKDMGIETFTAEPDTKLIAYISKLCDKFKINVAIHNHPDPSFYWNPDVVLNTIKGQSKRMGACADIGHWVRSGLDPVESLKKLEGRVMAMHMKDLTEKGNKKAHDLIWGQGQSNISGVAAELKRQNFKGMISAEYEYNWRNSVPEVTASIKYLRSLL